MSHWFNAGYVVGGLSGMGIGVLLAWVVRALDEGGRLKGRYAVALIALCAAVLAFPSLVQAEPAQLNCAGASLNPGQLVSQTGVCSGTSPAVLRVYTVSGGDLWEPWASGDPLCPASSAYCVAYVFNPVPSWGEGFAAAPPASSASAGLTWQEARDLSWDVLIAWASVVSLMFLAFAASPRSS